MRRLLTVLLLTSATAVALAPVSAAHADPAGTGYTLVFEDQFNGSALDSAKWNYRTDSKAYSTQRPQNVSVGGGALSIALKKETYGGKDYTGGGVVSRQTLRHGYYETRAKLNDGAAGNTATWRPNLRAAGTYRVSYYRVTAANSDPAAKLTVAGTQSTVNGTAGPSGWVDLGTFTLPAGTGTAATLTSSGTGCARADAVKFTRV